MHGWIKGASTEDFYQFKNLALSGAINKKSSVTFIPFFSTKKKKINESLRYFKKVVALFVHYVPSIDLKTVLEHFEMPMLSNPLLARMCVSLHVSAWTHASAYIYVYNIIYFLIALWFYLIIIYSLIHQLFN